MPLCSMLLGGLISLNLKVKKKIKNTKSLLNEGYVTEKKIKMKNEIVRALREEEGEKKKKKKKKTNHSNKWLRVGNWPSSFTRTC